MMTLKWDEMADIWSPTNTETVLLNDTIDVNKENLKEDAASVSHSSPINIPTAINSRINPDVFNNSINSGFTVGSPSESHLYPRWVTPPGGNSFLPSPFLCRNSFNSLQSSSVDSRDFGELNFMTYNELQVQSSNSSEPSDNGLLVGTGTNPLVGTGTNPLVGTGTNPLVGTGNNPFVGTGNNPFVGTGNNPLVGTGNNPFVGTGNNPFVGTGSDPGNYSSNASGRNMNFKSVPSFARSYDEVKASLTRNLLLGLCNSSRPNHNRASFNSDLEFLCSSFPRQPPNPRFLTSPDVFSNSASEYATNRNQFNCSFCKINGEELYNHRLKDRHGKVVCPVLYSFKCKLCEATGENAHTWKYCPLNPVTKGKPRLTVLPPGVPLEKIFQNAVNNLSSLD